MRVVALTLVWLALFRTISPGLVLGGVVAAVIAERLVPSADAPAARWWRLPGFVLDEVAAIARATVTVARRVFRRGPAPTPAAVLVTLPGASDRELSWLASAMTLTPGTWALDVDDERDTVTLHLLDREQLEACRDDVRRLHGSIRAVLRPDEAPVEPVLREQLADESAAPTGPRSGT